MYIQILNTYLPELLNILLYVDANLCESVVDVCKIQLVGQKYRDKTTLAS